MRNAFKGIIAYLSDWRNWVAHALVGVALLCLAIFLPVSPWIRVGILLAVVVLNVARMRISKRKKAAPKAPGDAAD
jgi:hypothetical protein